MLILGEGIFLSLSRVDRLYRHRCAEAVAQYGFTPNEIVVMMFLSNNAPLDTASDIVRYRGLSKSLIAKSVDMLCQRGFLEARRDTADRRVVHLLLTPQSAPVVEALHDCRRDLSARLNSGLSDEDQQRLNKMAQIMEKNLQQMWKEDDYDETANQQS